MVKGGDPLQENGIDRTEREAPDLSNPDQLSRISSGRFSDPAWIGTGCQPVSDQCNNTDRKKEQLKRIK